MANGLDTDPTAHFSSSLIWVYTVRSDQSVAISIFTVIIHNLMYLNTYVSIASGHTLVIETTIYIASALKLI